MARPSKPRSPRQLNLLTPRFERARTVTPFVGRLHCYHRGSPSLIRVFGQILADQAIFGLHDLAANLVTLNSDEPGAFDDVGLALMAVGQPTMNRTQQLELFQGETFKCAREVGRWLCEGRLKVRLDQARGFYPGIEFDQAVDFELQRVSQGLEQPITVNDTTFSTLLEIAADQQVDGRSTSAVCFGVALALIKARRFRTAVSVALLGYQASFDAPDTWTDCARFMELVGKASAEGVIVNDLPDWCTLMLLGEGADLALVPPAAVQGVVEWVRAGDLHQRAQLVERQGNRAL